MKTSGIYGWYNKTTDKWYVGSSADVWPRCRTHERELRNGVHNGPKFLRAWQKYGPDVWICVLLEVCPPIRGDLIPREQFWIDKLDSWMNGYNTLQLAGSCLGTKWTPERRQKTIASRIKSGGWKHTEETKKLISDLQRGVPRGPMSKEQKSLLSKIRKEQGWTFQHLQAIKENMRNRTYTDEILKNMSDAHLGYEMPSKQKTKIGDGNRGKRKHDWKSDVCSRCGVELREDKGNYLFRC